MITHLFAAPFVCLFECMVRLHLAATFPSIRRLHRSGFDCEILLIANCEFFHNSQSKESQEKDYSINNILPAWQFTIIKIAISLVAPFAIV